jgi:hypothetical protein
MKARLAAETGARIWVVGEEMAGQLRVQKFGMLRRPDPGSASKP